MGVGGHGLDGLGLGAFPVGGDGFDLLAAGFADEGEAGFTIGNGAACAGCSLTGLAFGGKIDLGWLRLFLHGLSGL